MKRSGIRRRSHQQTDLNRTCRIFNLDNRWRSSTSCPPAPSDDSTEGIGQKVSRGYPFFPSVSVCPARTLTRQDAWSAAGIEGCHSSCGFSSCEGVVKELRSTVDYVKRMPCPTTCRISMNNPPFSSNQSNPTNSRRKILIFVPEEKIAAMHNVATSSLFLQALGYPRSGFTATHSPKRGILHSRGHGHESNGSGNEISEIKRLPELHTGVTSSHNDITM